MNLDMKPPKRKRGGKPLYGEPMVLITFHCPEELIKEMDKLVEQGLFSSRSELIRKAIELKLLEEFVKKTGIKLGIVLG